MKYMKITWAVTLKHIAATVTANYVATSLRIVPPMIIYYPPPISFFVASLEPALHSWKSLKLSSIPFNKTFCPQIQFVLVEII